MDGSHLVVTAGHKIKVCEFMNAVMAAILLLLLNTS
jgi:hypothetical protein